MSFFVGFCLVDIGFVSPVRNPFKWMSLFRLDYDCYVLIISLIIYCLFWICYLELQINWLSIDWIIKLSKEYFVFQLKPRLFGPENSWDITLENWKIFIAFEKLFGTETKAQLFVCLSLETHNSRVDIDFARKLSERCEQNPSILCATRFGLFSIFGWLSGIGLSEHCLLRFSVKLKNWYENSLSLRGRQH